LFAIFLGLRGVGLGKEQRNLTVVPADEPSFVRVKFLVAIDMSFPEHPAATPTFAETINVDDHKVLQSDREYIVLLDGSISGQWIELLRESATSVLAEGLGSLLI